jgi:predicted nucleic acid-binding protein
MNDKAFLDTNVLIYAFSETEPEKRDEARRLLAQPNTWISAQVLGEFSNVLHRKFHQGFPVIAAAVNQILATVPVRAIEASDVCKALEIAGRYQLAYYDALIVASASALDCATLYSEDMQHHQTFASLRIVNPFCSS